MTIAVMVSFGLLPSMPANATGFHEYSVAYESSAGQTYTGIESSRPDGVYLHSPTAPSYIYQTEWVALSAGNSNFVELGTAHPPTGPRFWYMFVRQNGVDRWVWTHQFSTTATIVPRLRRLAGTFTWRGTISGSQFGPDYDWGAGVSGLTLSMGLESYDPGGVATGVTDNSMHYEVGANNVWNRWAGRDSFRADPNMCAIWVSDYQWRYGQPHGNC